MTTTPGQGELTSETDPVDYRVYTDGAALGNPGPGGAGIFIICIRTGETAVRCYGFGNSTNNRCELHAVLLALELIPIGSRVEVIVDTKYVIGQARRLDEFLANGWKQKNRKGTRRLYHRDLLQALHRLMAERVVRFQWVQGHMGVYGNELVDFMAYMGAEWASKDAAMQAGPGDEPHLCPEPLPEPTTASFVLVNDEQAGVDRQFPAPTATEMEQAAFAENQLLRRLRGGWGQHRVDQYDPDIRHCLVGAMRSRARTSRYVGVHEGNHWDFLFRYNRAATAVSSRMVAGPVDSDMAEFLGKIFEHATDFPMLRAGWERSARSGSLAAGVDGRTFDDYTEKEKLATIAGLQEDLRSGRWRPSPLRRVYVPKSGNRGLRPIDIPNVIDRAVETALYLALEPLWSPLMHDHSVGFRPGFCIQHGLAMAIWNAGHRDLPTMTALDLKKAFSRIPQDRLCNLIDKFLPNAELASVVKRIIRRPLPAGKGIRKGLGLAQGSPLSPLLLNLYLTFHLDRKWATEHPDWPLIRYADDLLLQTRTPGQAEAAIALLRQRLEPHGMVLRDDPAPRPADLRAGDHVDIWGLRLSRSEDGICIKLPEKYFEIGEISDRDRQKLDADVVVAFLRGKLENAGPAYPGRGEEHFAEREHLLFAMAESLTEAGIQSPLPVDELHRLWRSAYDRWAHFLDAVSARLSSMHLVPPLGAPPPRSVTEGWARTARQVNAARARTP